MSFIHLHTHSNYSLLTGASRIEDLIASAKSCGMPALALTDTNGLYGAIPFYKQAKAAGIKPILGAHIERDGHAAVCLARDREGYSNLCRIVTNRQLQETRGDAMRKPAEGGIASCPPKLTAGIAKYADGLYVLSSDEAVLRQLAVCMDKRRLFVLLETPNTNADNQTPVARKQRKRSALRKETTEHRSAINHPPSTINHLCPPLIALAGELGLGTVAGNNVMFATPDRYQTHRALVAVRENCLLDDLREEHIVSPEAYFKTPDQMAAIFRDYPEAIANTMRIADDCNLELEFGKPRFPKCDLPPGETAFSRLWQLAFDGARERYQPLRPDVIDRLKYELDVINQLGFAEYFLIVWDIVRFAREQGIPIVGRGSAADSLVAYVLGISSVDPIHFDLYFERFLNLHRTDCPDIDLDMCWRRRDEVIQYVYDRYGADRVAMICNHNTYQARSAFRDVARVYGLPLAEINRLAAMLPYYSVASIRDAMKAFPETRGFPIDREPYKSIIAQAEKIDGFVRHLSIHVGGIVIGDAPLTTYLPLERATKGLIVTQYDMGPVEDLGLVKIDLLGQRALSIIRDTVEAVERNYGSDSEALPQRTQRSTGERSEGKGDQRIVQVGSGSDSASVPLRALCGEKVPDNDPKTRRLLMQGKTIGCFQIESPGMRNLLQMMKAQNIRDVIMGLSLIRPGPSGSGMKERFIRRRMGLEPTTYMAPQLEPVLSETHGVMLYQEDILKVAHAIAGFTLADADVLRKGMSKARSPQQFEEMRTRFLQGAAKNGVDAKAAKQIWDRISNFASYSYCKAHATTYGHISYQATYLKAHYPAEFLAAVMSNQAGFYETRVYLEEARRLGVRILLPDINRSGFFFRAWNNTIRIGLMQVRGLSRATIKSLLHARKQRSFTSLADFCQRVKASYSEIENLILCGAMDGFAPTRPELLWRLKLMLIGKKPTKKQDKNQLDLFSECNIAGDYRSPSSPSGADRLIWPSRFAATAPQAGLQTPPLPRIADYSPAQKLAHEQHILQLAVTDHPLAAYEEKLKDLDLTPSHQLRRCAGKIVTVAGWLVTMRRAVTKNREYMKFMTIEDRFGTMEVTLFPDTYQKYGHLLCTYGPYVVNALVETEHGALTLTANWITTLDDQERQGAGEAA